MVSVFPDAAFSVFRRSPRPSAVASSARYWRLWPIGLDSTIESYPWSMGELELAAYVGGPDITNPAMTTAGFGSSTGRLIDNNPSVAYLDSTTTRQCFGHWWKVDLGSSQSVAQLRLISAPAGSEGKALTAFALHGSDDDFVTFNCYGVWAGLSAWSATQTRSFSLRAAIPNTIENATMWRARGTAVGTGTLMSCAELMFATTPGGATLTTNGTPFQEDSASGETCKLAFDGNPLTWWGSNNDGASDDYLGYAWPTPPMPVECRYQSRTSFANQAPTAGAIEWSADGVNFTSANTFTGLTWASAEIKSFTLS